MKKVFKHKSFILLFVLLAFAAAFSLNAAENKGVQQGKRTITGKVTDANNEPLISVSIIQEGTPLGTTTDFDGNYSISVSGSNPTLIFTYVGFEKLVKSVGSASTLDITMSENTKVLSEVVVTAMGIERKAESLTYATQQIGGKELTRAKDVNFINSLQGKSAGLTITPNASGAGGGSSKIILRGQSSILGNNQPLIVLDGIPLSNGMSSQTNGDALMGGGSRDGGDLLSTINPDDIANISILKGPNAAALYGSAANNGVIIITTKGGKEGKVKIDVSSNTSFESPLMYPKQQTTFAPEIVGSEVKYNGWGGKIADLTDDQLAMFPYLTRNTRNNVTDFFRTGQTYNNTIAISKGGENSSTYFSYGNTTQKGLIRNNDFMRHNFMFKQSFSLFDNKLKLDMSLNYITQNTKNNPVIGKAKGVLPGLYSTPAAVDLRYFDQHRTHVATSDDAITSIKGAQNLIGQNIQTFPWTNNIYINNPYFMLDAINDDANKDRILASFSAKYNILKGLSAQARLSIDKTITDGVTTEDISIRGANALSTNAVYWSDKGNRREIYSDYMLTYDTKINENISLNVTAGTSFKREKTHNSYMTKTTDSTYVYPNIAWPIQGIGLSKDPLSAGGRLGVVDYGNQTNWEAAIFATAQVGLWEKGYIDMSFRNDWSKAFQQFASGDGNKSFPYYSIGGNLLLKELLALETNKVNSMKLRASYSVVGNSVPNEFYAVQTINPLDGSVGARESSFDNPKPETTQGIEIGLDGAFFNYKLDFDVTLYQSTMENQFLRITTASGQSKPVNSGKVRNRGIEVAGNYHMSFLNNDLRWSTGLNLSYNDNEILETYKQKDGTDYEVVMSANGISMQTKFIKGRSYGDLYGKDFNYRDGKIVLQDGAPQFSDQYDKYLGNTTAKFNFGWNNTVTYKGVSLYMLIDGKIGGKVLSMTQAEMDMAGLSERSAQSRLENGGMVTLPDGQQVTARKYYEAVGGQKYDCIYDATNIRLREMSLGYTFTDLFGAFKNLTVSVIARNIGFIYKNSPVDPDISATAGNTFGGIEAYSLPTTRSFGLNLKFTL